jgi:site-specific recombinase XerD
LERFDTIDQPQFFQGLFVHADARSRHLNAPMLRERGAYLANLLNGGRKQKAIASAASMLCHVIRLISPIETCGVSEDDIAKASARWMNEEHRAQGSGRKKREETFKATARGWFRFLGVYAPRSPAFNKFQELYALFVVGMRDEYGYLPSSIHAAASPTRRFLEWVSARHELVSSIRLPDVDAFLDEGRTGGWSQQTIRCQCQALRTFFRYAEQHGWSNAGLSKTIKAPVSKVISSAPQCPTWPQVRKIIGSLDQSQPSHSRAKAILLLASVYGMRSCEITRLTLDDLDWYNEVLTIRRAKRGRLQQFPIQYEVGQAIIHYLQKVRPPSKFRNVFLTLQSPYRPVEHLPQSMWRILRTNTIDNRSFGLHSFRHACATELLRKGTSLQAIADLLGHRTTRSVSIYAKCDIRTLKKVAKFSLSGVL